MRPPPGRLGRAAGGKYDRSMERFPAVDVLVLAALADRRPTTGRGLAHALRARIYPALRRLERDELIASTPLPESTRRQRLYRLTDGGAEALAVSRLAARPPTHA